MLYNLPLQVNFETTIILLEYAIADCFEKLATPKWRVKWFVARGNSKTEGERKSEVARQEHPKRVEISSGSLAWEIER